MKSRSEIFADPADSLRPPRCLICSFDSLTVLIGNFAASVLPAGPAVAGLIGAGVMPAPAIRL